MRPAYRLHVFSTQFLQSNITQQHVRCIRHGMRFGRVSHSHIFPCTTSCRFCIHAFVVASFSCIACQSVSLRISLCSLEHCFTASTRIMSENKQKKYLRISHDPLVICFSSFSHQHASLIAWSEIYCHASHFRNMSDKKQSTQKQKSAHLPWPIGHNLVVRTSVCLLHMA